MGLLSSLGFAQEGQGVSLEPAFLPDPIVLRYHSGGAIDASQQFGADCKGFISQQPDHTLELREDFEFLHLKVVSESDTTLIVIHQSSQQVWCNDDYAQTINPQIRHENWPLGRYDIYVGSFKRDVQGTYELFISEFRSDEAEFRSSPQQDKDRYIILDKGFSPDPARITFSAGGPLIGSERFGGECRGYISDRPDHILDLKSHFDHLSLTVESEADTSIILLYADGHIFCNDNQGNNPNPALYLSNIPKGSYEVYVGNFIADKQPRYTLLISNR